MNAEFLDQCGPAALHESGSAGLVLQQARPTSPQDVGGGAVEQAPGARAPTRHHTPCPDDGMSLVRWRGKIAEGSVGHVSISRGPAFGLYGRGRMDQAPAGARRLVLFRTSRELMRASPDCSGGANGRSSDTARACPRGTAWPKTDEDPAWPARLTPD
ncbi:hypothetical protein GCM10010341_66400 [Streptomyces noursei]|nr:hypothetical protein GCM10010341_66400 [Streptomyces noursei]